MPSNSIRSLIRSGALTFTLLASASGCAATAAAPRDAVPPVSSAGAAKTPAATPASAPTAAPANAPVAKPASGAEASAAKPAAAAEDRKFALMRVPLLDEHFGSTPAARVDDDVITLDEIVDVLAASHMEMGDKKASGKGDALGVLERLIELRLFVAEARDMKLDQLPEVKATVADYERITLREMVKQRAVKGVTADAADVEDKYKTATREWKVKSVLFPLEADAKEMAASLKAGKKYDELAKAALDAKKAKTVTPAEALPTGQMLPQVRTAVQKLKVGEWTQPLQVPGGFAILAVVEIGHKDDPSIRAAAESASRTNRSVATLRQYYQALVKKYAKVDTKLLAKLDLEAKKPGFEALRKDKRVLCQIAGEKPITVGDLVAEIDKKFFHGVDSAIKEKRLNGEKYDVYEQFVFRKLLEKEGAALGIPNTPEYKRQVAAFAREQIFSQFLGRALLPDVKVHDADVRAYYDSHDAEFQYARFFKLSSLAFKTAKEAQSALDKLNAGTDFNWVKQNADGVLNESDLTYQFHGRTLSSKAIAPELAKLLEGTKRGDHRLFAADDGKFYVMEVADVTPPEKQPFEEASGVIAKKLFGEKANAAVKEWARKLREGHDVEVYISRIGA